VDGDVVMFVVAGYQIGERSWSEVRVKLPSMDVGVSVTSTFI
jgi:hypothetical protein